jgi:hypothetical protein
LPSFPQYWLLSCAQTAILHQYHLLASPDPSCINTAHLLHLIGLASIPPACFTWSTPPIYHALNTFLPISCTCHLLYLLSRSP